MESRHCLTSESLLERLIQHQGELARAESVGAQRESGDAHPLARSGQPGLLRCGRSAVSAMARRGRRRFALCPRRARRVARRRGTLSWMTQGGPQDPSDAQLHAIKDRQGLELLDPSERRRSRTALSS